ncbi:MAG: DnaA/Hda family protein [Pseudomonadota bacterium]
MASPPHAQLTFDLPHRTALERSDFLVSTCNAQAVALIDGWRDWPGRRLALTGAARAGKSHLTHVWQALSGAKVIAACDLAHGVLPKGALVAVEDVDQIASLSEQNRRLAEETLFHLYNRQAGEGGYLLLSGAEVPARWASLLPDLRSRLATLTVARIEPPDDMLLSSLMVKHFNDRQIRVAPDAIAFMVRRMERSCAAAEDLVERLDAASLTRKRALTIPFVREVTGWKG